MVTIRKDSIIRTCTNGAFNSIFKNQGWVKIEGDRISKEEVIPSEEIETPLSEMTMKELREYAHKHNIDISGAKKKEDIKNIIQSEMEA